MRLHRNNNGFVSDKETENVRFVSRRVVERPIEKQKYVYTRLLANLYWIQTVVVLYDNVKDLVNGCALQGSKTGMCGISLLLIHITY